MKTFRAILMGLGLILACSPVFADPLANWYWRNPLPNGNPQAGPHTLRGIVFAAGKFVAVGDSGVVSISPDATNWVESPTATTNKLNAIIYASGEYVAVGNTGTVETSLDATNWTLQNTGITNSLGAVAFDNETFVAVGGQVIASPDAVHWSPAVSGLSSASGVAGGNNEFVAIDGSANVYFSTDGLNWGSQTLAAPGTAIYPNIYNDIIIYAKNLFVVGSHRYATSTSADYIIYTSVAGQTWTTNVAGNVNTGTYGFTYNFFMAGSDDIIAAGNAFAVPFLQFSPDAVNWSQTNNLPFTGNINGGVYAGAYGNGTYVIVSPTVLNLYSLPPIFTSPDGLNWTNQQHPPTPPSGPADTFTSIASGNGLYVATATNSIARSADGLVYTNVPGSPALAFVITNGSGFVGVGSAGSIYVSSDGLSWTQRNSGTGNDLQAITDGNGLLVTVGGNGAVQTSTSGTIWTGRTSGTSLPLFGVTYANALYVAVGQLGTVLTSPDGMNWTGQDSGQLTNLLAATHGSAGFLAVGLGGTILTSPDGVNWTPQNSGVAVALRSATFGNGYYLVTGDNSTALTSPDGVNWTPRQIGATGGQALYGSAFLGDRFDVVGAGGTIIESDPVAPLFDLQIQRGVAQNTFSMFAPPGSSFRLQACTDLTASNWVDAATFANVPAITLWTNSTAGFNARFYRAISP